MELSSWLFGKCFHSSTALHFQVSNTTPKIVWWFSKVEVQCKGITLIPNKNTIGIYKLPHPAKYPLTWYSKNCSVYMERDMLKQVFILHLKWHFLYKELVVRSRKITENNLLYHKTLLTYLRQPLAQQHAACTAPGLIRILVNKLPQLWFDFN